MMRERLRAEGTIGRGLLAEVPLGVITPAGDFVDLLAVLGSVEGKRVRVTIEVDEPERKRKGPWEWPKGVLRYPCGCCHDKGDRSRGYFCRGHLLSGPPETA